LTFPDPGRLILAEISDRQARAETNQRWKAAKAQAAQILRKKAYEPVFEIPKRGRTRYPPPGNVQQLDRCVGLAEKQSRRTKNPDIGRLASAQVQAFPMPRAPTEEKIA
jgi:hypothetical protein